MDHRHELSKEHTEHKTSNTEYLPTKCRITRPPPPKPAANPLQFIKVAPCPLYRKAQEQIKKVEEIKTTRQHVREEAEDWQQNLDNWKSSRRKRQEHIIERVVEVKKLEQEEQERHRRKSKTFNEMIEERSKGRHKFNIPIYDDDSNDLSDYGIGSSSSKANSVKDVDTDDSGSILDDKDHAPFDSPSSKDANLSSNYSQSEDENLDSNKEKPVPKSDPPPSTYMSNLYTTFSNGKFDNKVSYSTRSNSIEKEYEKPKEEYTYEGAIQDYRTRIKSKINISDSVFNRMMEYPKNKENIETQSVIPKGHISKRKELFEVEKPVEINHYESLTSKRLSEDFANTQSIRERLQSFEKVSEQNSRNTPNKTATASSIKSRIQNFSKTDDTKNNNYPSKAQHITSYITNRPEDISLDFRNRDEVSDRSSSSETELYMNKLNMFNNDLDNLFSKRPQSAENEIDDLGSNYPASTSSTEMLGACSDREDSGIHTTDVSCSVSQADEPVEYSFLSSSTIEKLSVEKDQEASQAEETTKHFFTKEYLIKETEDLLESLKRDSSQNQSFSPAKKPVIAPKPVIYENVEIKPYPPANFVIDPDFPLAPPKVIEPPKAKPPPPPPSDMDETKPSMQRNNSTKRIKKEIHNKRSSFLGLDPTNDQIEPEIPVSKPPDITSFLQKESKMEKSLYKKLQENQGSLTKVESQDSGLDIERGRLSSDTWCSSIGDSSTMSHGRQDSEQTNSITSEEDEITKKEREIIEIVEKEEKSRDTNEFTNYYPVNKPETKQYFEDFQDQDSEVLKVEHELLQLEKEQQEHMRDSLLFQESRSKLGIHNNRHSLENICDNLNAPYNDGLIYRKSMPELQHIPPEYRKSMPDVPNYKKKDQPINLQYRKSVPDIQQAYYKSTSEYQKSLPDNNIGMLVSRKSMPELKTEYQKSAFYPPMVNRQPIMPGKPLRPKDPEFMQHQKPIRQLTRQSGHVGVPKVPSDGWIQPRQNPEAKSYNQHWLYQEAELRRISEQQAANSRLKQQAKQEKHIPDDVIKTLTQRVQNRVKSDVSTNKEFLPHTYMPHSQTLGHALPMSYPPLLNAEESQDRVLSVSGKKKCSYCGNELGRGAAMIIESLCLFYHMECFKCCVCHMQLGDGRMGTDVRVRNQKLHCHNCYSSDDGIKFSCV